MKGGRSCAEDNWRKTEGNGETKSRRLKRDAEFVGGVFNQVVFWKDKLQVECTHSPNRELKTRMARLEKAMEEKDEILELLTASKDSLEKEAIDRKTQLVSVSV